MNKLLNIVIGILIMAARPLYAYDLSEITLKTGERIIGESIEVYSDRWFYESPIDTKSYQLIFIRNENQVRFELIEVSEIESKEIIIHDTNLYKKFLEQQGIIFEGHPLSNAHVLTGHEGHHKYEKMYGNFAWDLGVIHEGQLFKNNGEEREDYYVFNAKVYSPLDGIIIGAVKSSSDNPVDLSLSSDLSNKLNNYITIQVHPLFYISLVHFKQNTISRSVGDKVKKGDFLGLVGNSGVSYIPHLHYTLYTYIPKYKRFISIPPIFRQKESL